MGRCIALCDHVILVPYRNVCYPPCWCTNARAVDLRYSSSIVASGGFSHGSKGSMEPPFFADNLTDQPGPWHCVISKK